MYHKSNLLWWTCGATGETLEAHMPYHEINETEDIRVLTLKMTCKKQMSQKEHARAVLRMLRDLRAVYYCQPHIGPRLPKLVWVELEDNGLIMGFHREVLPFHNFTGSFQTVISKGWDDIMAGRDAYSQNFRLLLTYLWDVQAEESKYTQPPLPDYWMLFNFRQILGYPPKNFFPADQAEMIIPQDNIAKVFYSTSYGEKTLCRLLKLMASPYRDLIPVRFVSSTSSDFSLLQLWCDGFFVGIDGWSYYATLLKNGWKLDRVIDLDDVDGDIPSKEADV